MKRLIYLATATLIMVLTACSEDREDPNMAGGEMKLALRTSINGEIAQTRSGEEVPEIIKQKFAEGDVINVTIAYGETTITASAQCTDAVSQSFTLNKDIIVPASQPLTITASYTDANNHDNLAATASTAIGDGTIVATLTFNHVNTWMHFAISRVDGFVGKVNSLVAHLDDGTAVAKGIEFKGNYDCLVEPGKKLGSVDIQIEGENEVRTLKVKDDASAEMAGGNEYTYTIELSEKGGSKPTYLTNTKSNQNEQ